MRGKCFCKNKSKKMQNCEETETNLQVMIKGNQIKNFSKERLKTSQTRLPHTQATVKVKAECKPSSRSKKEGLCTNCKQAINELSWNEAPQASESQSDKVIKPQAKCKKQGKPKSRGSVGQIGQKDFFYRISAGDSIAIKRWRRSARSNFALSARKDTNKGRWPEKPGQRDCLNV